MVVIEKHFKKTLAVAAFCSISMAGAVDAELVRNTQSDETLPAHDGPIDWSSGIVMLDYKSLNLTDGGGFDLFGIHYLHQLNDWLYVGASVNGPMFEGDFGGFFALGATIHAQTEIFDNWTIDGGVSIGAGAGGDSIGGIKELSGTGSYANAYIGVGYSLHNTIIGLNYSYTTVDGSRINDRTFGIFIQSPVSFQVGSYGNSGSGISSENFRYPDRDTIVSFELNQLSQIDPSGAYKGNIGLVSAQFSHFVSKRDYVFFGLDLGYSGLMWYNQVQGGYGRRVSLSDRLNGYVQLGIGSSGWVTDTIDTGSGVVMYPKVKLEHQWENGLGLFASAGYLFAPNGSSRNWTMGVGLSYDLFPADTNFVEYSAGDFAFNGIRINALYNLAHNVVQNGEEINDLQLLTFQFDYSLGENWYIPLQIGAAMNSYKGYAGYAEALFGIGWQSSFSKDDRFQWFAQSLYGMNDIGISEIHDAGPILNLSMGMNYSLTDTLALHARIGRTISINQYIMDDYDNFFEYNVVGMGLTYRFSIPARVRPY